MIFNWSPEFIDAALDGLSVKQLAALDLASSMPTAVNPGAARLEKSGFENAADYEMALAQARANVLAFFAVRGIRHVSDLDFVEPDKSAEGRIQQKVAGRTPRKNRI